MTDMNKSKSDLLEVIEKLRRQNREQAAEIRDLSNTTRLDEHLLLLDSIDTHIFYLTDPATYGLVNKAHAVFFGVEKAALEHKSLYDILSYDEAKICIEGNQQIFSERKQVVTEELLQGADGSERLFSFTKTPKLNASGDVEYVVCTGEDITERKDAERLLTFTQFTIDQAKVAIFWCHADGRFFYVNKTACEWLKYDFAELKKMHVADINPEFPREAWEEHWQEIKEKRMVHMESHHRRKSGETFPVELYSNYVQFEGEEYKLSFVNDISEKVKARAELQKSQDFLEDVIESIQDGVSVLDKHLNIVHTNKVMREWYGSEGELVGRKCYNAYHGFDSPCEICPTRNALNSGKTESEIIPGLAGEEAEWLEVFSYPFRDRETQEISGVVEFVRDISDRVKLERQVSQAQKMEAVGTLSGGIAHDFNNILQAILGSIQLLLAPKRQTHPDYGYLKMIEVAVSRAKELTSRLLYLGRNIKSDLQPVDLNVELSNMVRLLERSIPKMVSIKQIHGRDLKLVWADIIQIEQVILNLAINASHAMPDGGELTLKTENTRVDEQRTKIDQHLAEGDYVTLTVSDTGVGMDRETMARIYEPFFTTKTSEKGSGLGLSMVYGIVKSHGGAITCYSKVSQGTTFRIYFPAVQGEIEPAKIPESEAMAFTGTETVMLVDDEKDILELGCTLLEQHGYRVVRAESGEEAVAMVKSGTKTIDLVILDLNMPGMGGFRCLLELKKLSPKLKVIVASGFAANGNTENVLQAGAEVFLTKPYQFNELLAAVREIIDKEN